MSVTPSMGPSLGGPTITVTGANFCSTSTIGGGTCSSASPTTVTVFNVPCTSSYLVSTSAVLCVLPVVGSGDNRPVVVQVDNQASPANEVSLMAIRDAPIISFIFPAYGPTGGGSAITIAGRGFGTASVDLPVATINFHPCLSTLRQTDSAILCIIPPGVGGNLAIDVLIDGQRSFPTTNVFFSYQGLSPQPRCA